MSVGHSDSESRMGTQESVFFFKQTPMIRIQVVHSLDTCVLEVGELSLSSHHLEQPHPNSSRAVFLIPLCVLGSALDFVKILVLIQ